MKQDRNTDTSPDPQERDEGRLAALERELRKREERIQDLERRLSAAQDLEELADRFSKEMLERLADHQPASERNSDRQGRQNRQNRQDRRHLTSHLYDDRRGSNGWREGDGYATDSSDRRERVDSERVSPGTSTSARTGYRSRGSGDQSADRLVSRLRSEILSLDRTALGMLRHYRDDGPTTPRKAHSAAGGSGERVEAYAANRQLRERGLVAHVGRGQHDYALPALVVEEATDPLTSDEKPPDEERDRIVRAVETAFVDEGNLGAAEGVDGHTQRGVDNHTQQGVDNHTQRGGGGHAEAGLGGYTGETIDGVSAGDGVGRADRNRTQSTSSTHAENGSGVLDSFGPWPDD